MRLRLLQGGDTIVEVLIAMAIVSLVLLGAYAATTRDIRSLQDTQEHSQALQLVQTQVEFLSAQKAITGGNCFDAKGTPTNTCNFSADGTVDSSHQQPEYTLSISNGSGACANSYEVKATWDSVINNTGNVAVCYRPQVAS